MPRKPREQMPRKNPKDYPLLKKILRGLEASEQEKAKPHARRAFIDCYDARIENLRMLIDLYYKPSKKGRIGEIPGLKQRKKFEINTAVKRLKRLFQEWKEPHTNIDVHYAISGFIRWIKHTQGVLEKKEAGMQAKASNNRERIQINLQKELLEKLLETARREQRTELITGNRKRFVELVERKALRKAPEKRTELIVRDLLQAAEDLAEHTMDKYYSYNIRGIFEATDFSRSAGEITSKFTTDFKSLLAKKDLFPKEKEQAIKSVLLALNKTLPEMEKRIFYFSEKGAGVIKELEFEGAATGVIDEISYKMERERAIAATIRSLSNAIKTTIRSKRKRNK